MAATPSIRLMLAKEGLFATLCELGLSNEESPHIWNTVLALLGGQDQIKKWAALTTQSDNRNNNRSSTKIRTNRTINASNASNFTSINTDRSPPVVQLSNMAAPDRNWDLEVRGKMAARQMVPYQGQAGWQWSEAEVMSNDVGSLQYGHVLNVSSDQTHHLMQDKSVPNIRMNTLLQIILGMLNSGLGGKIYIGLSESGVVQGAKLTRDQRDCFMLGYSKLVSSEIVPSLLPCDALIQIVPVVRPLPSSSSFLAGLCTEADYFTIVLTVRPQAGFIYRCRDDPEPVLVRGVGGATTTLRGPIILARAGDCARGLEERVTTERNWLLQTIIHK